MLSPTPQDLGTGSFSASLARCVHCGWAPLVHASTTGGIYTVHVDPEWVLPIPWWPMLACAGLIGNRVVMTGDAWPNLASAAMAAVAAAGIDNPHARGYHTNIWQVGGQGDAGSAVWKAAAGCFEGGPGMHLPPCDVGSLQTTYRSPTTPMVATWSRCCP